ncbi:MAG TPA: shikimate kinase [Candidatus Limnocylindrales bacterium]
MRIFLIGLMGTGKSTIGRRLASATGWPYFDNDRLIEAATGRAAPELMRDEGEAGLHAAEMAAFEHALTLPQPVIISGAGYVVTDAGARQRMRASDVVVWLRADAATLAERARHADGRRDEATSLAWIERTAAERDPLFHEIATLIVDTDKQSPKAIVDAIVAWPAVAAELARRVT